MARPLPHSAVETKANGAFSVPEGTGRNAYFFAGTKHYGRRREELEDLTV